MKSKMLISLLVVCSVIFAAGNAKKQLQGTWCAGSDGLLLTFFAADSIKVGSTTDESVQGNGVYKRTDTTFSAIVKNSDVTMNIKYRYRWVAGDTVSAQAIHFTVNGDSVQVPSEWVNMVRCSSKK